MRAGRRGAGMSDAAENTKQVFRSFDHNQSFADLCRPVSGCEVGETFAREKSANSTSGTGDISKVAVGSMSTGHSAALAVKRINARMKKRPVSGKIG